jgi:lysophospholipase L1-like esterase
MARLIFVLLVFVAALAAQARFYLKPGDRVVFYGDSITDQRLYTTFVESYAVTRFPGMNVAFVHSGWGGDRVSGGGGGLIDTRLSRDVYAYRPTVITIMLGMNDGRYRAFDPAIFDEYASGYRHIVSSTKEALPGARMTLIQPSPYDDVTRPPTFEGGYNKVLLRCGQFVRELAAKESLDSADLNSYVVAALEKAMALDAAKAPDLIKDRVHPGPGGHLLMAAALLKAWNAPALVSSVEIEGTTATPVNATVDGLSTSSGTLTWTATENALPMPLDVKDGGIALALKSCDFAETLDREALRVSGLAAPSYRLTIDGEIIGDFTRMELAGGVNLATLPTPMLRQSLAVHALTLRHNNIHFARWRNIQVPLEDYTLSGIDNAESALDSLEAELVAQQRAAAQPKPHRFVLAPITQPD